MPNLKECRRVSIAVEALLQRGPGAPEPLNEAVERLVSRGPEMGMEPEHEERERVVALARTMETAVEKGVSAEVRRGCARPWIGTGTLFGAVFVVTRLPVSSRSRRRLNQMQRWSGRKGVQTHPSRPRGCRQHWNIGRARDGVSQSASCVG